MNIREIISAYIDHVYAFSVQEEISPQDRVSSQTGAEQPSVSLIHLFQKWETSKH